jgi:hypothetical protein
MYLNYANTGAGLPDGLISDQNIDILESLAM